MGVAALKLAGVVNKRGRGRKNFRARFARGLFSTLLDEILDTSLMIIVIQVGHETGNYYTLRFNIGCYLDQLQDLHVPHGR